VDELLDGPDRLAVELDELSRERLDDGRRLLAGLEAENAEVARRARVHFDAQRHEESVRVAGEWQLDDDNLALSGEQQGCLLYAAAERLMGHGRLGSAAAAPGRRVG